MKPEEIDLSEVTHHEEGTITHTFVLNKDGSLTALAGLCVCVEIRGKTYYVPGYRQVKFRMYPVGDRRLGD